MEEEIKGEEQERRFVAEEKILAMNDHTYTVWKHLKVLELNRITRVGDRTLLFVGRVCKKLLTLGIANSSDVSEEGLMSLDSGECKYLKYVKARNQALREKLMAKGKTKKDRTSFVFL